MPYWFEEALLAFLRQGDLIRVRRASLLSESSHRNPFCQQILAALDEASRARTTPAAWLGISWRQFLYWFSDVESRIRGNGTAAEAMLRNADANWSRLDAAKVLLEERFNTGDWIRVWLNAMNDFLSGS